MLYLAFSKFSLFFLLFPAFLILALFRSPLTWLVCGFLFSLSSLFWVRIAMIDYGGVYPPIAYSLLTVLAVFLGLYQFGFTYLLWKILRYNLLTLPFLWTLVEILRSHFPYGGFPWLLAGEMILYIPLFKNYLSAGGVYLGSILMVFACLIPLLMKKPKYLATSLIVFIIPVPFIKFPVERADLKGLKVALFQTNVPEHIKLSDPDFYRFLPSYWKFFDEMVARNPDIIFLPESAFPFDGRDIYAEGRKLLSYSQKSIIISGLTDLRLEGEGYRAYNSVFVIHRGEILDFYDKVRILPFGEFVPFPFQFAKNYFGAIGGIDFTPGPEPRCVRAGRFRVGTPICFEVSYYTLVKKMSDCADFIAVLTNDAWFRDSDGTFQHLRQARVRAVETRKYVLWVNNTGPSAVISPQGELLKVLPYGKQGYIFYEF